MEVRLFATLRENRGSILHVDWHENMDGSALLESLNIPAEDAAIFLVNGKHSQLNVSLNADDVVAIFPPVGGG